MRKSKKIVKARAAGSADLNCMAAANCGCYMYAKHQVDRTRTLHNFQALCTQRAPLRPPSRCTMLLDIQTQQQAAGFKIKAENPNHPPLPALLQPAQYTICFCLSSVDS